MISYEDFIKLMEKRGYIHKNQIAIDESNPNIEIFPIKKHTIGKVLEFQCPDNIILSICGKNHGCNNSYYCRISFFDHENRQPFQELHNAVPLTKNYNVVAEIITTKILQKSPDKNNTEIQKNAEIVSSILKIIGSDNPFEYPMWSGIYNLFSKDFLNNSLNLYPKEKIIFYAINPDIDIEKVTLEIKADIFEKSDK